MEVAVAVYSKVRSHKVQEKYISKQRWFSPDYWLSLKFHWGQNSRIFIPNLLEIIRNLFYVAFTNYDYIASNERVKHEWWIGKDLEGSGRGLISR
jgi:hypothetical protein